MTDYKMGIVVMDFLQDLGVNRLAVGEAIEDKNLKKVIN
jgi:hypothetical protein